MSPSPSSPLVPLSAKADSATSEIFVIDRTLQLRASGVGRLSAELPEGFYKVRFRSGDAHFDELVELSQRTGPVFLSGPTVYYESSVPIGGTRTSRESHAGPAQRLSQTVHERPGAGSRLFVFSRDLVRRSPDDAWRGVSLHSLGGERLAELSDGETHTGDAWAGIVLELDPGTYRLQVDSGDHGVYEMFVVTCPGWQTQVFAMVEEFVTRRDRVRRTALRSASVLMTRPGMGFDHDSRDLRLADLARLGLGGGRKVVRQDELESLLYGKFQNPMLGIYGAHLLLMRGRRLDRRLLGRVTENLRSILGTHPDVLALRLKVESGAPPGDLTFPTPPMLRSSWDLVLRGTRRRNAMVPRGSPSDLLADGMIPGTPWLLRRVPRARTAAPARDEGLSFAASKRVIGTLTSALASVELAARVRGVASDSEAFSPLERSILSASGSCARQAANRTDLGLAEEDPVHSSADRADRVLAHIEAPPSAIARSTLSALRKLSTRGFDMDALGIDMNRL